MVTKEPDTGALKSVEEFIDAVANDCIVNMSEETKRAFIGNPDPYAFHFGYGLYIRNYYIHNKKMPFITYHPDSLSHEIIVKIIEIVNSSDNEK